MNATTTPPPPTPECDRLNAEAARHRIIGDFIEWMGEQGYSICKMVEQKGWGSSPYLPVDKRTEQVLADFFEIDLNKVEDERRAYLAWHREQA